MKLFQLLFGWRSPINRSNFWAASIIQNVYGFAVVMLIGEYSARITGTSILPELKYASLGALAWLFVPAPLGIVPLITVQIMALGSSAYLVLRDHGGSLQRIPADLARMEISILLLGVIALTPVLFSTIVVGVKRLHDRGKSGRWLLLYYLAPLLLAWLAIRWAQGPMVFAPSLVILLLATIELGFLRGTAEPNEYKPA
jgi:uncharacterized membrane protein YhaH (DUF805 family)